MKKLERTDDKSALIKHINNKIENLQKKYPMIGHEMDHVLRVTTWTRTIAAEEKARNPFLCELAAWLHDIGRAYEHAPEKNPDNKKHQELSYDILRHWINEPVFNILNQNEKIELLYAVRYHGNDAADQYDTAWILRDADKLDMLGEHGLKRIFDTYPNDEKKIDFEIRIILGTIYWLKTKTAKNIVRNSKLTHPLEQYKLQILQRRIQPIKL